VTPRDTTDRLARAVTLGDARRLLCGSHRHDGKTQDYGDTNSRSVIVIHLEALGPGMQFYGTHRGIGGFRRRSKAKPNRCGAAPVKQDVKCPVLPIALRVKGHPSTNVLFTNGGSEMVHESADHIVTEANRFSS
jgi:hypothetical protein